MPVASGPYQWTAQGSPLRSFEYSIEEEDGLEGMALIRKKAEVHHPQEVLTKTTSNRFFYMVMGYDVKQFGSGSS